VAWGRNLSMRLLGERVMDVPWLYAGGLMSGNESTFRDFFS
jgi:salicylate hydroxylase